MGVKVRRYPNLGENRWRLDVRVETDQERKDFQAWMKLHCPHCFCSYKEDFSGYSYQNPNVSRWFEVRGTNQAEMMMIVFAWGLSG